MMGGVTFQFIGMAGFPAVAALYCGWQAGLLCGASFVSAVIAFYFVRKYIDATESEAK